MVHSDAEAIERMGWTPSDLIDILLQHLGPDGTLAMPTHPRLQSSESRSVYDVRRSPSTVGLLTELFRRRHGAERSACPLSAAAALGSQAHDLVASHADSWAPHDEHSPYAKLAKAGGKVLCIGCPLDRMTIVHVAEDVLREELAIPRFHRPREFEVRDGADVRTVTVHERAPWLWWYLNLGAWTFDMYSRGCAEERKVHSARFRVADAHRCVETMISDIEPVVRSTPWPG